MPRRLHLRRIRGLVRVPVYGSSLNTDGEVASQSGGPRIRYGHRPRTVARDRDGCLLVVHSRLRRYRFWRTDGKRPIGTGPRGIRHLVLLAATNIDIALAPLHLDRQRMAVDRGDRRCCRTTRSLAKRLVAVDLAAVERDSSPVV